MSKDGGGGGVGEGGIMRKKQLGPEEGLCQLSILRFLESWKICAPLLFA